MANQIERDVYVATNATVKNPIDYVAGTNALPIVFNFRDFDIPDGAEATYYVKKPSKKAVWNAATISGNTVTIPVTTQTFAEEGISELQVRITQGEEILVTFEQPVKAWPNHTNDDAEESTNESDLLDQYIQEMQEKGDQIIGQASTPRMRQLEETPPPQQQPRRSPTWSRRSSFRLPTSGILLSELTR